MLTTRRALTDQDVEFLWEHWQQGWPLGRVARALGRSTGTVQAVVARSGGVRPPPRSRAADRLTRLEREEISRGVAAGESARAIAARLGRAPSTVSRELVRNGGRRRYRAQHADTAAWSRAVRPKPSKLTVNAELRAAVTAGLRARWSPQQIAGWLRAEYPDRPEMWVSHETIYLSLFVQGKGLLRRELSTQLRSGRAIRRPAANRNSGDGRGQIVGAVHISERPAEAEDRACPVTGKVT